MNKGAKDRQQILDKLTEGLTDNAEAISMPLPVYACHIVKSFTF